MYSVEACYTYGSDYAADLVAMCVSETPILSYWTVTVWGVGGLYCMVVAPITNCAVIGIP